MFGKKGFTLLEIIVVLLILGIIVAFAIPNFLTYQEQMKAQTAEHNLLAISAAQLKYYEDHNNVYCLDDGTNGSCAHTPNLNANLKLSIQGSDAFTYTCVAGAPYTCTATDGTVSLDLNPNPTFANPTLTCLGNANFTYCNITCTSANNGFCPSNIQ